MADPRDIARMTHSARRQSERPSRHLAQRGGFLDSASSFIEKFESSHIDVSNLDLHADAGSRLFGPEKGNRKTSRKTKAFP